MASAAEAALSAMYIAACDMVPLHNTLVEAPKHTTQEKVHLFHFGTVHETVPPVVWMFLACGHLMLYYRQRFKDTMMPKKPPQKSTCRMMSKMIHMRWAKSLTEQNQNKWNQVDI